MEEAKTQDKAKTSDFKRYLIVSAVFLALGIIFGVFYREFSKAFGVVNVYTPLGLVHTHSGRCVRAYHRTRFRQDGKRRKQTFQIRVYNVYCRRCRRRASDDGEGSFGRAFTV